MKSSARLLVMQRESTWNALEVSEHVLSRIEGELKTKTTKIMKRAMNWRLAMVFEAWANNANLRSQLKEKCVNLVRRWRNRALTAALNSWKTSLLYSKAASFRKKGKLHPVRPSTGIAASKSERFDRSDALPVRPKTADGSSMRSLRSGGSSRTMYQDVRSTVIIPNALAPSNEHSQTNARRIAFRSTDAVNAARQASDVRLEAQGVMLETFQSLWNNYQLFSEYRNSDHSLEGLKTRYCLRALGRRTGTMDFNELLNLLQTKSLLKQRGDFDDPLKLSVSTVHSVFRVVNLKCYTSWWSTMKAKKSIDTFDGAADKYELGFPEYQMVMLVLGRELGLSLADMMNGASISFEPSQVEKILNLARYDSNRLSHTAGAPLHVARVRHRDACESAIDLLAAALRAAEIGNFERARSMIDTVQQITALTTRPDLLCEVQITSSRIESMEKTCLARESRMRSQVDRILTEAEARARALEIERSKKHLREAATLTAKDHYPRRDSLQSRFNTVMSALDAAELVIKGDDKIKIAWDCVQRDELVEAKKHLDDARVAYASTELRAAELQACADALDSKCRDEARIRAEGQGLMALARQAIVEERFLDASQLIEQAKEAFSQWTQPAGKNMVLISKITSMIAKTWQNKPLFEAFCAFDDKNLSGQGSRALMMDFNEFLFLLQDLGILGQRIKRGFAVAPNGPSQEVPSSPPLEDSCDSMTGTGSRLSPTRRNQTELCNQCTCAEIRQSSSCKLAKADIYEVFRAVNFRSVVQLHKGNIDADDDMSSLNYAEYQLCMLRLGKLLGVPLTDLGSSPLFQKDFRDLEDLRETFIEAKLKVRERLLQAGEHFTTLCKNSMQECNFIAARVQLQLAIAQYEKVDDEQILRHYLANCKRLSDLVDREEKKEGIRKSELALLAEASLNRVKLFLDEFEQLGCRFDESKFKICDTEADNARKFYKSAQMYGIQQKHLIQDLKKQISFSEQLVGKLRMALFQGQAELQIAENLMESFPVMKDDFDFVSGAIHSNLVQTNIFENVLSHLEAAKEQILLSKDPTASENLQSTFKRFLNFAETWLQQGRDATFEHLDEAQTNLMRAISSSGTDWKGALGFLNKAVKARDRGKACIDKATYAKCALPYLAIFTGDVFHSELFSSVTMQISAKEIEWNEQRLSECTEGTKLINDCKLLVQGGDFMPATHKLIRAKSLLKGDHVRTVTALEQELKQKMSEDDIFTQRSILQASQRVECARKAQNSSNFLLAFNEAKESLEIMDRVRSVESKPNALCQRQQAMNCQSEIIAAAADALDDAITHSTMFLNQAISLIYEVKYSQADAIVSQALVEMDKLKEGGALRVLSHDLQRHQAHEDIMRQLRTIQELLQQHDTVLQQLAVHQIRIRSKVLERAAEMLREANHEGIHISEQDLNFLKELVHFSESLPVEAGSDSTKIQDIQHQIIQLQLKHEAARKNESESISTQISQISLLLQQANRLDALFVLMGADHVWNHDHQFALDVNFKSLKARIISDARDFLQTQQGRLSKVLLDACAAMSRKQYRLALNLLDDKQQRRLDNVDDALYIVQQNSTAEYDYFATSFENFRSEISDLVKTAKEQISAFDSQAHEINESIRHQLDLVKEIHRKSDFESIRNLLENLRERLAELNELEIGKEMASLHMTKWEYEWDCLGKAQQEWDHDQQELCKHDLTTGRNAIHSCCAAGDSVTLHRYLLHKPDLFCTDHCGRSALHLAAANGHKDCVVKLLEERADINGQDAEQATALMLAIQSGSISIARFLLSFGADVNISDAQGRIALHYCAMQNSAEAVEALLWTDAKRDDANLPSKLAQQLDHHDSKGATALILAICCGCALAGEAIISSGGNPRLKNPDGYNALHLASQLGMLELIPLLLKCIREVDCPCSSAGASSLQLACIAGKIDTVQLLLQYKANPNFRDKFSRTPLQAVCFESNDVQSVEIAKLLLNANAVITSHDATTCNPLVLACARGRHDLARTLLEFSQHLSMEDVVDAYFLSVLGGQYKVLEVLCEIRSDLLPQTKLGWNILHVAIVSGSVESVKLVLKYSKSVMTSSALQNTHDFARQDIFAPGDLPLQIARKCKELVRVGKFYPPKGEESFLGIEEILLSHQIGQDEGDITSWMHVVEDVAPINLEEVFQFRIFSTWQEFELGRAKHDYTASSSGFHDEQSLMLVRVERAEQLELERRRNAARECRLRLNEAVAASRAGNCRNAWDCWSSASSICSAMQQDKYQMQLIRSAEKVVVANLVEVHAISVEKGILDHGLMDIYDVNSGYISFCGLCEASSGFQADLESLWQEKAKDRIIKSECSFVLNSVLDEIAIVLEKQHRESKENEFLLRAETIRSELENIAVQLRSDDCSCSIELDIVGSKLESVHAMIEQLHALELSFSAKYSDECHNLKLQKSFLEKVKDIRLHLLKVKKTSGLSVSWCALSWAQRMLDSSKKLLLDSMPSPSGELQITSTALIEDILSDCSSKVPNCSKGMVDSLLIKIHADMEDCHRLVQKREETLRSDEARHVVNVVLSRLGPYQRCSERTELCASIQAKVELCKKLFNSSEYEECTRVVDEACLEIEAGHLESQMSNLDWLVVHKSRSLLMRQAQQLAEECLTSAEGHLQIVEKAVAQKDLWAKESESVQISVRSATTALEHALKHFHFAQETRTSVLQRISCFEKHLQHLEGEVISLEVQTSVLAMMDQVEMADKCEIAKKYLFLKLQDATLAFRKGDFVKCRLILEEAKSETIRQPIFVSLFDELEQLNILHKQTLRMFRYSESSSLAANALQSAQGFLAEKCYEEAAEALVEAHHNFMTSSDNFMDRSQFASKYLESAMTVIFSLYQDWITDVCIFSEEVADFELTNVTILIIKDIKNVLNLNLQELLIVGNADSSDCLHSVVRGIRAFADCVPGTTSGHEELSSLADDEQYLLLCLGVLEQLTRIQQQIFSGTSRRELRNSSHLLEGLREKIPELGSSRIICETLELPVSFTTRVQQVPSMVLECQSSIKEAEDAIDKHEQSCRAICLSAELALAEGKGSECIEMLDDCCKAMIGLDIDIIAELKPRISEMRVKAQFFITTKTLDKAIEDTQILLDVALQNCEFDRARECVELVVRLKQERATLAQNT